MTYGQALTMVDEREQMPKQEEQEFWRASYWDAVAARDRSMDGVFLYAVFSTGVYCRPSCPSRRPKPENVVFFRTRDAAMKAGFRACKRCKPDNAARHPNSELVEKVCRYIDAHPDEPATLETLSRAIGLSPFHLQRTFKSVTGITPRAYADSRRLQSLKAGLREGHSVTRSLYDAGYGSSSRLYERATSQLGMTPLRYRKHGTGITIQYTIATVPDIGHILLASTPKGVCCVQFGDSDRALNDALRHEFPHADLVRADRELAGSVRAVQDRLSGEETKTLPLDIRATAFQRLVWEELRSIPYGSTQSYSEIARRIGHPQAARAVARACATNPVAVAIPCHRVVREDGDPGGYRWGIRRKQRILSLEKGRAGAKDSTR